MLLVEPEYGAEEVHVGKGHADVLRVVRLVWFAFAGGSGECSDMVDKRQTDSRRSVRRSIADDPDNGGEGRADEVRGVTYLDPERPFER